ncbi:MAG: deoxynucleoside kinase [Candidatus Sericytochromatia bacterium]|nr:deoxynucleoside kinase [Candidatus Sericytochromatia bacterium]
MQKKFVVVAGNIGSGKTTLTRYLSRHLGFIPNYESVDGNPYLVDFYQDMQRWSFPLQIYFLGKRFESHRQIVEGSDSVIQDRSVYEDCAIFAENLRRNGQMTERDFANYRQIYEIMGKFFRPPDLVIYLKASLPTLQKRIARRGRDYEAEIPMDYLTQLNGLYDEWIDQWRLSPVLTLPADELDFVHNSVDCCNIYDLVETALDLPPTLPGLFPRPEIASI